MMFLKNCCSCSGTKLPFWIFIIPVAISLAIGIPLIAKYPVPIAILLASLIITLILVSLCLLYEGVKIDGYVQRHDFKLWKKSKEYSWKIRREASKEIMALASQVPYLEKHQKYAKNVAFILLGFWTLIFVSIFSFIIFSSL